MDVRREKRIAATSDIGPYGCVASSAVRTGDLKGRPYGSVIDGAVGRADVGSELSAVGGRESEVSEWPRSKF